MLQRSQCIIHWTRQPQPGPRTEGYCSFYSREDEIKDARDKRCTGHGWTSVRRASVEDTYINICIYIYTYIGMYINIHINVYM